MKIACYVHPLVHKLGPCFDEVWSELFAGIMQCLHREAHCECLLITGNWFKGCPGLPTIRLNEVSLYQKLRALGDLPTSLEAAAYLVDELDHPAFHVIAEEVARSVDNFAPDIVLGVGGHANYLAKLWPKALRLHVECGPYSRNPYPSTMFFDHLGMHGRSVIGRFGRRIAAGAVTTEGHALVSAFRSKMALALKVSDPFESRDFRSRYDRLCLLPLQVSNEFSFDEQAPYRSQFEFLYDVLCSAPKDVGIIVTEHPAGRPVLKRRGPHANVDYLRKTLPNLIFFDEFRTYATTSQFLVPRVDGVWSVSSSVGYQALLLGRTLGTPSSAHLSQIAHATTFREFFEQLGAPTHRNLDAFLAWQLERYLVPEALYSDGPWLCDYLQRRLNSAKSATDPVDAFVPIAETDQLTDAWIKHVPRPEALRSMWPTGDAELFEVMRHRDALLKAVSWRAIAPFRVAAGRLVVVREIIEEWLSRSMSLLKGVTQYFTEAKVP